MNLFAHPSNWCSLIESISRKMKGNGSSPKNLIAATPSLHWDLPHTILSRICVIVLLCLYSIVFTIPIIYIDFFTILIDIRDYRIYHPVPGMRINGFFEFSSDLTSWMGYFLRLFEVDSGFPQITDIAGKPQNALCLCSNNTLRQMQKLSYICRLYTVSSISPHYLPLKKSTHVLGPGIIKSTTWVVGEEIRSSKVKKGFIG